MSPVSKFPAFLEPQRIEARRLYEQERWSFTALAARFGVTKGTIAGLANRQQWTRVGAVRRQLRRRSPEPDDQQILAGPRDPSDAALPDAPHDECLAPAEAEPPATVDAPHPATAEAEGIWTSEAEEVAPPAAVVAVEKVVAGASSIETQGPETAWLAPVEPAADVAPWLIARAPEPAPFRPGVLATDWGDDRTRAERSRDRVFGEARRLAAPPVLTLASMRAPAPRHRACQWPIDEPGVEGFHFCDAPIEPGSSYCSAHRSVAYVRPRAQPGRQPDGQ